MKQPADMFYFKDWLGDEQLQKCSPSTRGIWFNFLCYMFLNDRCGKLVGNRTECVRLGACNRRELKRFFDELCTHKFADLVIHEKQVTIINRRMHRAYINRLKDKERQKKHRCHGNVTNPFPTPISTPIGIDKNNTPNEVLELDLAVAQERNFFMDQISRIFHPNKRESVTFARITRHLVRLAQEDPKKITLFKNAVEWAKQAKASSARNKKGLFVAKIKKETNFRGQEKLL